MCIVTTPVFVHVVYQSIWKTRVCRIETYVRH
nr:MAG TPA: hypothetical protein [Caudoviricetes sp.]